MSPVQSVIRLLDRGGAPSAANANRAAPVEAPGVVQYPASLAQQRFWVLDQLEPGNVALNVAVRWRIEGDLPPQFIRDAFARIVERHEPLRTSFFEIHGEPFQAVQPDVSLRVPSIDLTTRPEAEALAECDRIARTEATTPFDLTVAPLIRVTHVRVRPDVAVLLVTVHHTVCDGWSIGLLAQEMCLICAALQTGRRVELPDLPTAYGDYAAWQRDMVLDDGLAPEIAYWSQALNGFEYFELPTDFPRKSPGDVSGAIQSRLLDRALTDRLVAVARAKGCTLFMLAYTALVTLLHRYTGATDIALGTQVAGRSHTETENLVGLFINTLVLRADLTGEPTFAELLDRTRRVIVEALEHEAMPLEKVIDVLSPKRYPGNNSVFSINFIYQRSFVENTDCGTFKLVDLPSQSAGALHDLNFFMVERPEGWRLSCEFNTGLYERSSVERLLQHFVNILSAVSADATLPLAAIPIMDVNERRRLLEECNATGAPYPRDLTLPDLFTHQAGATPGATAVVAGAQTLTYRDLEERSNALAHRLIDLGFGPGARIGVFVERTADLVIAPLAILKAGNAYVPLDPAYPTGRLAQIIEQSGMVAIVAQSAIVPPPLRSLPIVGVEDGSSAAATTDAPTLPQIRPDDTAYIIFTSGSTGQPKGVQIAHRALTNFLWAMRETPGFGTEDSFVAVTTICFDIAGMELFLPLTLGASVVIANEQETRDGAMLLALLKRSGPRVLQATPATWQLLLEAGWRGDPQLRMLCGGEALPRHLAERLLDCCPELWNMYGPTETTIWSSAKRISRADRQILIGSPIANTQFYIVDPNDALVPTGGVGELLIAGDGVAVGYWGMRELTRQRFPADWFSNTPGAKLYRTGDLVRMHGDGEFQYLGRSDQQVKIRGFRIELGEIEAVFSRQVAVRQAIAIVRESASGDPAIFAYVALHDGVAAHREQIVEALWAEIDTTLPSYMRPQALTVLDAIPLLPNGKINRKALPAPAHEKRPERRTPLPPLDDLEASVAQIWCEILGVDSVDDSANFFELGGHSLLAARLLARVEAVTGRRIGLSALFEAPGFTAFVKLLRALRPRDFDFRQVVRMGARNAKQSVFAINNTGIFLTLSQRLSEDLSITACQLFDPATKIDNLPTTIEETAGQYLLLIKEVQPTGPYSLLGWCNGGSLAFEIARQLQAAGETISGLFLIDAWIPGYLEDQSWLLSKLADYAYRWGLIRADWETVRSGQKSVLDFLLGRPTLRRFYRRNEIAKVVSDPAYGAAQAYDRWLLDYSTAMRKAYRPKPIRGRLNIVRSTSEPAGRFLDPKLGWSGMADEVDLAVVPGDHLSIFNEPGVSIMARRIEAAMGFRAGDAAVNNLGDGADVKIRARHEPL